MLDNFRKAVNENIRSTLQEIGEHQVSARVLVDLSFYCGSGYEGFHFEDSLSDQFFGLQYVTKDEFVKLLKNYILPNTKARNAIEKLCRVDVEEVTVSEQLNRLRHDIAFQTLVSYYVFKSKGFKVMPADRDQLVRFFNDAWIYEHGVEKEVVENVVDESLKLG